MKENELRKIYSDIFAALSSKYVDVGKIKHLTKKYTVGYYSLPLLTKLKHAIWWWWVYDAPWSKE